MAASLGTMKLPVLVRYAGKEYEVGTLELEIKVGPGGKPKAPTAREIERAFRKVR